MIGTSSLGPGPGASTARITIVFVCVAIALAYVPIAIYTGLSRGVDEGVLILSGAAGLLVVALPVFWSDRFSAVEPISVILIMTLIGFCLKTIYVVYADTPRAEWLIRYGRTPTYFLPSAALTIVGLGALSVGYMMGRTRVPLERMRIFSGQMWAQGRVWTVVTILGIIAALSTLAYVTLLDVSFADLNSLSSKRRYSIEGADTSYGSLGYLVWGARCAEYAAYILYAYALRRERGITLVFGLAVLALVLLAAVVPIVSNSRQSVALILINILVITAVLTGRIKVRYVALAMVTLVTAFIMLTVLRQNNADEFADTLASSAVVEEFIGSRHFNDFTRTGHVVAAVPQWIDYKYGSSFVAWMVAPVPRVMWKEKPFLGTGKEVAELAFGYTDRRGVPPGLIAETVMNFGVWMVPLILFLAGVVIKIVYLSFKPILGTVQGSVMYVMLAYPVTFTWLNNETSMMMTRAIVSAIPFILIFRFLQPARRSRRVPAGHPIPSLQTS